MEIKIETTGTMTLATANLPPARFALDRPAAWLLMP